MGKKVEKEKNELVEEFFRRNDPKNIKSMSDMYAAWKDFFAPAFQQLLDAEMEAKRREMEKQISWCNTKLDRQLGSIVRIFQIFTRDKKNHVYNECNRKLK